jgi:hypothetical protein
MNEAIDRSEKQLTEVRHRKGITIREARRIIGCNVDQPA